MKRSLDEQRAKLAGAQVPNDLSPAQQTTLKQAIDDSFVAGFRQVMLIAVVLSLMSALSALWLIQGKGVAEA